MRILLFLVVLLAALPVKADDPLPGPYAADVIRVVDGDTLLVSALIWPDLRIKVYARLSGLCAPELRGDGDKRPARAAKARLEELTGESALLHNVRIGKYARRVIADVSTHDGSDVGKILLAEDHAYPADGNGSC